MGFRRACLSRSLFSQSRLMSTKNMEVSDKDLNEGSDEDVGDDAFPEKTAEEKNKKREQTEVDKVSNEDSDVELDEDTPVKKKAKKSPSKAPAKKTSRRKIYPERLVEMSA